MADESQALHDLLMMGIHQAMSDYCDVGMEECDAVAAMMVGLAGAVAETMATLAISFQPDDPRGSSAFYRRFRGMVSRMMKDVVSTPAVETVRQTLTETRSDGEVVVRTLH